MSTGSILSQTKLVDIPAFARVQGKVDRLRPGMRLLERFELQEEIGAGGMGRVFGAYDWLRQTHVAIKVLSDAMLAHPEARERFMREAQTTLQLAHSNIVRVFDVRQDGDMVFLVMELLRGYTLRDWMESYRNAGAAFTVDEIKRVGLSVCAALEAAHQITVHRDIKPENLFINADEVIKLMDFGIARDLNRSQLASTAVAIGTVHYMAPEQASGSRPVDQRADLYALGVVLYEMLAGNVPMGMAQSIRELRPDVPAGFARVIEKALMPLPEQRYASAAEFGQALQTGRVPGESLWTRVSQSGAPVGMIAAGVLVVVLGGGAALAFGTESGRSLLGGLGDLVPAFGEEAEQVQKQAVALSLEVKDARKRIDDLITQGSRDPKNEIARRQATLLETRLFTPAVKGEVDAGIELAQTALREKSYKKAQRLLGESRARLQSILTVSTAMSELLPRADELRQVEKATGSRMTDSARSAVESVWSGDLFMKLGTDAGTTALADTRRQMDDELQRQRQAQAARMAAAQAAAAEQRRRDDEAHQRAAENERLRLEAERQRQEYERQRMEAERRRQDDERRQAQEARQRQLDAERQRAEASCRSQDEARQRQIEQQRAQRDALCERAKAEAKGASMGALLAGGRCKTQDCFNQLHAQLNQAQQNLNRYCE